MTDLLAEMVEQITSVNPEVVSQTLEKIDEDLPDIKWRPSPGPQTECYFNEAFITLYGGAGGGGKSDCILGLAFNEHKQSLIMRRQYSDMSGLTKRAIQINGTKKGFSGSYPPKLDINKEQRIEFGAAKEAGEDGTPGDEEHWQGQAHDLLGVDEAAQFAESQIGFLKGWVRSAHEGQRCRIVLASNPPMSEEGMWLIEWFAPWLDPQFPNPAKPGELRYTVTDKHGKEIWVDGPGPHPIEQTDGSTKMVEGLSRTFIPAKVTDNPYLRGTEYEKVLDSMVEPFRSALRDGIFQQGIQDHQLQVIPSDWIRQAQARWHKGKPANVPMCALGVDVAKGGKDNAVIAPRYDGWYDELIKIPGFDVPYGRDLAGHIVTHRKEPAHIVLDLGGGHGSACFEHLEGKDLPVHGHKGADPSTARTKEGKLAFFNKRAEVIWQFREALDPSQPEGSPIALPPDQRLYAGLCAFRIESMDAKGIKLETKKAQNKRLGWSPDEAEAVVMGWSQGQKAITDLRYWQEGEMGTRRNKRRPGVKMGHDKQRRKARS